MIPERSDGSPFDENLEAALRDALAANRPPAGLQQRLLDETTAVVRRRRRGRLVLRMAGVAAVYFAGVLTALWSFGRPAAVRPDEQTSVAQRQPHEPDQRRVPFQAERAAAAGVDSSPRDPEQLRQRVAQATGEERIGLLRQAGDVYLSEQGDLESALQCYQQVLELTPPERRSQVQPDDTWLLAQLKSARQYAQ